MPESRRTLAIPSDQLFAIRPSRRSSLSFRAGTAEAKRPATMQSEQVIHLAIIEG